MHKKILEIPESNILLSFERIATNFHLKFG